MEQVRVYRNAVFQYGGVLAAQYGKEIHTMCEAHLSQQNQLSGLPGLLLSLPPVPINFIEEVIPLIGSAPQTSLSASCFT